MYLHPRSRCAGSWCCLHNPSEHRMREWPLHLRTDAYAWPLMERICPCHGVGHPDPDSVAYCESRWPGGGWGTHGCQGCCSTVPESED